MKSITALIASSFLALLAAGAILAAEGKPQTVCPVLGGKINQQVYVDYQGQRVYFCCPGCDKEFQKDPEKYMKKLQEQGVTLQPCPVQEEKK